MGKGMDAYRQRALRLVSRHLETPLVRLLVGLGVTPNQVTLLGLLLGLGAAYLASQGWLLAAGALLGVASALDTVDGMLARSTGRASPQGALLDSMADRLSEAAILLGLLLYYTWQGSDWWLPVLVYLALANGLLVSYIRARAEGVGVESKVGIMTRPERMIVLTIGLLVGWVEVALGIIVALSLVTWVHRFLHTWRALGGR
jgi:CDP-diacylglycerol--glycerol-3-phosphate 3-phosphatidyltransferase